MNSKDIKELWSIVFDMSTEIIELSDSIKKAHTVACEVYSQYFSADEIPTKNEGVFMAQYEEIQTKTDIISDYTYKAQGRVSNLDKLHDKLTEWYNNHKEE